MASDAGIHGPVDGPIDDRSERDYNLRLRHPERGAVYDRFAAASALLRQRETGFAALRYAHTLNGVIDWFPAAAAGPAPLFLFIHGGYWRALDRSIFSFLAQPWLARGVHVAMPGYELAPAASVREIATQLRAALDALLQGATRLGIDTGRIVVSGHSAGAHLGALLLNVRPDWSAAGFVGISGIYDLAPLRATTVNRDIRLDAAEAVALSPLHRPLNPKPRYLCAVGGAETGGFRGQSQNFHQTLCAHGCESRFFEVPQRTHFDVLDALADADAPLFRAAHSLLDRPARTAP